MSAPNNRHSDARNSHIASLVLGEPGGGRARRGCDARHRPSALTPPPRARAPSRRCPTNGDEAPAPTSHQDHQGSVRDDRQADRHDERQERRRRQVDRVATAVAVTVAASWPVRRPPGPGSACPRGPRVLAVPEVIERVDRRDLREVVSGRRGRDRSTPACARPTGPRRRPLAVARRLMMKLMMNSSDRGRDQERAERRDLVPEVPARVLRVRVHRAAACPAGRGCASGRTSG